jgi:hypothetical protein
VTDPDEDSGFSWVPFGPIDPRSPSDFKWYEQLEDRNCGGLSDAAEFQTGLWAALAAVCRASIQGDESAWTVAQEQAAAQSADQDAPANLACLQRAAERLLADAIEWHEANPGEVPRVRDLPLKDAPVVGGYACEWGVEKMEVANPDGTPSSEISGPVGGETLLALWGPGLADRRNVVTIGGVVAEKLICNPPWMTDPKDPYVYVIVPPSDEPGAATVVVSNELGSRTAPESFRYLDDAPAAAPVDPGCRSGSTP